MKNEIPTGSVTCDQRDGIAHPEMVDDVVDVDAQPPCVLEPAQQSQLGDDGRHHPGPPSRRDPGPVDQATPGDRAQRRDRQEEDEAPVPPSVEHVAGDEDEHPPLLGERREQPVADEDDPEEDCKISCREKQPESPSRTPWQTRVASTLGRQTIPILRPQCVEPRKPLLNPDDRAGRAAAHRRGLRTQTSGGRPQRRALIAAMSLGSTLVTSPTTPRSATLKMGASRSLLIAMMFCASFMPTTCRVAPEIPHAM